MGPVNIKEDVYSVMTNSRELTNYCQESVGSAQSKKISNSLNNFHLETAINFITKSLTSKDRLFFETNEVFFDDPMKSEHKENYNKVIDYIESYFIKINS
tara:strand:+ start:34 stop:333 length:300 start_codon:yes stop_codon:yes gene_type:complete